MGKNPLKLFRYALAGWAPGGRCHCIVCGHDVWRFMPYRSGTRGAPPLMRTLAMVGSDPDRFECPRCGAHDRERHLLMYLRAAGILEDLRGKAVLHFAPEKRLSRFVAAAGPSRYIQADLFPNAPGVQRVDMLDMQFGDGSFDCVIANHVLEHVSDVPRALAEIRRVLKHGGLAILQTPYSAKLRRTWEDEGIDDPATRLQAHGQEDHVRLFGRDIFERITVAGFENMVRGHSELLENVDPARTGVNRDEPFFLFRKV
ncbi:MAG TPA: methyltransferase domain-containing protein [Rhodanobacteraceae bacterium]|nr:methyltransferase domain-containing protein [Rhodanobacteraceae bacterium]